MKDAARKKVMARRNTPSLDEKIEMYRRMRIVRLIEEGLAERFRQGLTRGPIHTCDGQEAVGIGVTAVLDRDDLITSTHRGHAHFIGKGLDAGRVLAEIFGKETGYCRGRAGHMLVASAEHGLLGGSAIVGGALPVAIGQALGFQIQGSDRVVVPFFGDGAAHIGMVHESLNIAGLWKLPIVFVCEHNEYGLTVHARHQSPVADIAVRAEGYGMPGIKVDGNDAVAVYRATADAVAGARRGDGPTLIEAKTYRMTGFSTSDQGGYQPDEEMEAWRSRDPIRRLRRGLAKDLAAGRLDALDKDAERVVTQAFAYADDSPLPPAEEAYAEEFAAPRSPDVRGARA